MDQYDTVTVTGHSKGGNKAKYITVMDDSVDRCLSFDGQGFSDEFIEEYKNLIAENQGKISNNNVDRDYVNLLLNDIGNTTFYHGYGYGLGSFLENHCPNTFFDFQPDGSIRMNESVRDEGMASLDKFLNSYLRTLSPEEKQETLLMIGRIVEKGFGNADADQIMRVLLEEGNLDHAASLAAYLLIYQKENQELVETIDQILNEMGMKDIADVLELVMELSKWEQFKPLIGVTGLLAGHLPDSIYSILRYKLAEHGIHLSEDELKKLLKLLELLAIKMYRADIKDNGMDRMVHSGNTGVSGGGRNSSFMIEFAVVNRAAEKMVRDSRELLRYARRIQEISQELGPGFHGMREPVQAMAQKVLQEAEGMRKMGEVLKEIIQCYRACEAKIAASAGPDRAAYHK